MSSIKVALFGAAKNRREPINLTEDRLGGGNVTIYQIAPRFEDVLVLEGLVPSELGGELLKNLRVG